MNHQIGLFLNNNNFTLANTDEDSLRFKNNIIAADFTSSLLLFTGTTSITSSIGKAVAAEDQPTRDRLFKPEYQNDSVNTCSLLTNAWSFTNPDYRPNPGFAGNPATDPANLNAGADLTPGVILSTGALFNPNQTKGIGIFILENGGGPTQGVITMTIPKLSGYTITVPGLTLTGTNQPGIDGTNADGPYTNGSWLFKDDGVNIVATSKAGVVIPKNGFIQLGFNVTRPATTPNGTSQNLSVNISGGADVTPANNNTLSVLGTN